MKFKCRPSYVQVKAARKRWHRWFAWYPVRLEGTQEGRWLETVMRRDFGKRFLIWEYKSTEQYVEECLRGSSTTCENKTDS